MTDPTPRRRRRTGTSARTAGAEVVSLHGDDEPKDSTPPGLTAIDGETEIAYTLDPQHRGLYRAGARALRRLTDWCPEVVGHLVRLGDDGRPVERRYVVVVGDTEATVTTDELLTGSCWHEQVPTATGVGKRAIREALHNLVLHQAVRLPVTWMVHRSGWHTTPDGAWGYVRRPTEHVHPVYARQATAQAFEPVGVVATGEITRALDDMARRGWGPILGLSTGLRAIAHSIVPVRSSLIVTGDPNTGKTLTAWSALATVMSPGPAPGYWPPLADASFSDTITAIERKVAEAGDRAVLIDDMPLTAEATAAEERDANAKLDRIVRAAANDQPIRDRADRNAELRESTKVVGVPVITAQKLPPRVQASLLRRAVVADFHQGDNDTRWYRAHGAELVPALRSLGDRTIRGLSAAGLEAARAAVAEADRAAIAHVEAAYARVSPGDVPGMDGVVLAAGQMVAGLMLAQAITGIDTSALVEAVTGPLAASLAAQAGRITDRQTADTGTGEALGGILRAALYGRRAHVRDQAKDQAADVVPGQTRQAQGLRESGDPGPLADGVPLWWLGDRQALGVTTRDLHTLVTAARDPRLAGFTPDSLARYLLREGVTIPGRHKDGDATDRVRIGPRDANRRRRLVLIPAPVVFDWPEPDPPDDPTAQAEPQPTPPAGPAPATCPGCGYPLDDPAGPCLVCTAPGDPSDPTEPVPVAQMAPGGPEAGAGPETPAEVPKAATGATGGRSRRTNAKPKRVPGRRDGASVLALGDGWAATPGPAGWTRHRLDPADFGARLIGRLDQLAPDGDVTVVVADAAHQLYGLPEAPPVEGDTFLAALAGAGYHRPHHPDDPPAPTAQPVMARVERSGTLRLVPMAWLGPDDWPRIASLDADQAPDVLALADRFRAFHERTGWVVEGTIPATAVRVLRSMIEDTTPDHRRPIWQGGAPWAGPRDRAPVVHQWVAWSRDLTDDEAERATHVRQLDAVRNYLAAYRQASIARHELRHDDAPVFDERKAGLWEIVVPTMPTELVPPPLPRAVPGSTVWTTTDRIRLYVELGITPEIVQAWTAPRWEGAGLREFTTQIRDVLAALAGLDDPTPTDRAVAAAVKHMYRSCHGNLRRSDQRVIARPDWGHAIRDAGWCSVVRRTWQAAGLIPLPGHGGEPRRYAQTPRYPVAVNVDEVAYPAQLDDPIPEGFEIADRLGGFHEPETVTIDQWREARS